jgi:hypothetical protein
VFGQDPADSGWVRITTEPASATVFVDGRLAGSGPIDSFRVPSGKHIIQAQRHSPYRWTSVAATATVEVRPGMQAAVHLLVPSEVIVRSTPPGALVMDGELTIGTTPLRVAEDRVSSMTLNIEGRSIPLTGAPDSSGVIDLKDGAAALRTGPAVMTGPGVSGLRSESWTLTAGGAMIVSGVLAAVFRGRANDAAATYMRTQDPKDLADVRRFDRLAGASMAGVQVSLGAFVLLLIGS